MAAPTSTDEVLMLVRKSGLVPENRLDAYLRDSAGQMPPDPIGTANNLVRNGILTKFQAGQIVKGRYRSFHIGRYRVLEPLGIGGMSRVYLCEHTTMGHRVAIKLVSAETSADPALVQRFFRESRSIAALNHPNIVRAHDAAEERGKFHYLVMEYIDGVNLHDLIYRYGPLSAPRVAHYIAQAATGLQYLFAAGLVHRDIKPGNLLLDRKGVVKILDLGLARKDQPENGDSITATFDRKAILGTADFMSPEQAIQSSNVDIRADIYSLGATMYFMLSGRAPFPGDNFAQKLLGHQMLDPDSLANMRPELPAGLIQVASKMMAKRPDDRYQEPEEIVEALEPWTREPIDPPLPHEIPRRAILSHQALSMQPDSSLRPGSSVTFSDTPAPRGHMPSSVLRIISRSNQHPKGIIAVIVFVVAAFIWWVVGR